ncbi:transposase, mutator type [Artemisia annua]|uniref:Transposase, mutator type n=1 Tax=Artemisia annua TaxID=35608 RepID=A0A2U1Q695_ARTAN|nr:transposase, mutator type [Artemisia annua]
MGLLLNTCNARYMGHPNGKVTRASHSTFVAFISSGKDDDDERVTLKEQLVYYYMQRSLEGYPGVTPFEGMASGVAALVRNLPAGSPSIFYCVHCLVEKASNLCSEVPTEPGSWNDLHDELEPCKKLLDLLLRLLSLVDIQVLPSLMKLLAQLVVQLPEDGQNMVLNDLYVQVADSDDVTRKPALVSWVQSLSYLSSQATISKAPKRHPKHEKAGSESWNKGRVRKQGSQSNPYHDYRKFPTVFCLKINHGGEFTTPPKIRYRGGKVNWIDTIDADVFSINEINHMMKDIGYENPSFEYFYKEPNTDLENGLKKLDCDQDVLQLMKFVAKYKVIELYVVHGVNEEPMNVVPLNVDDSLINKDMDNFVLDDNGDDVVDDVSEDEWLRSCLNLVPRKKKVVVESEVVGQSNRDNRDESTRSEVEREHGSSSEHDSSYEDDSDSQDSDFDEPDNIIDDVEVDMAEFKRNIDENVEWVGSKDKVEQVEEVFEDEEVDYEDMDTGSESENEGARRKALNMHIRKQKADAKLGGNVWKENFFIGQEFESNTLIKEMLTRVSVEQRRQLYLKKNDKNRLRAHCRGKVPQFTFEDGIESRGSKGKLAEGSKCKVAKGSKGRVAEGSKVKGAEGSKVECAEGSKQKGVKGKGQVGGSTGNFKDGGCSIEDKEESCPWFLQCSKLPNQETWAVKTFHDTHTCLQSRKVKRCTATFLSKTVEGTIKPNPKIPLGALKDQLQKEYELGISNQKVFRAKKMAMERIDGNHWKQYAQLKDYCLELRNSNPNTTVKIEVERPHDVNSPERKFKRVYICLGPLKDGFKAGKRELLGLDGCFLSGVYPGWILTAVGIDPNNGIYPLAYAIVESENKDSWKWFLDCVGDDLDLFRNSHFTFISDRQKGIIPAIAETFPSAEHRFCLKHIYDNMKLQWRGQMYKQMLWRCAASNTVRYFEKNMETLKAFKEEAYEWLKKIPPQHWSRSHFTGRAHCDVLLNNICEVFNRQLVDGRDKPIITCLEYIRVYLMKRIVNVQKVISKSDGILTPNANKIFQAIVKDASQIKIEWNGADLYQANDSNGFQCVVNMRTRECSCRKWELTGIPCKHAVAAIWNMASNGEETGIPETYCHETYWLSTWKAMYRFKINPPNGPELWEKSNNLNTIIPPAPKPQIGRPPKKRRKSAAELAEGIVQGKKLSRAGKSITCSNCKGVGHNKKSCPNVTSASNAQGPNVGATHTTHAYRDTQAPSEIHICSQAPPATQVTQPVPSKRQKRPVKKMNL